MKNLWILGIASALVLATLFVQNAVSEEPPELSWYRVVGIEEGKELELRKDPDPASEVVGGLPENATCVCGEGKPVKKGGVKFIYVSFWDWQGWAEMKYLKPMKREDCETDGEGDDY